MTEGDKRVARAACLACRSAKRRCDGQQPVCGPCAGRGIQEGGCNFVTSKRGGPRFKGVKGADAVRVKEERERQRQEGKSVKAQSGGIGAGGGKWEREQERERGPLHRPPGKNGRRTEDSGSSQASSSPSVDWAGGGAVKAALNGASPLQSLQATQQQAANRSSNGDHHFMSPPSVVHHMPSVLTPGTMQSFGGTGSNFGTPGQFDLPFSTPGYQQQMQEQQQLAAAAAAAAFSNSTLPFGQPPHALPLENFNWLGNGDILSFENLETLQRMQERSNTHQDEAQMSHFFSRLEVLPKAGVAGGAPDQNPLDVLLDWEGAEIGTNLQDNEIGVRALLADFYELVYPSCPVLPSPGNLPSLAFYFSGKGPCGLFAALSAVVALHLPQEEAHRTLKASQHPLQRFEGSPANVSVASSSGSTKANEDLAAYHAKASEFIIHQWEENNRTCFLDPTAPDLYAGSDDDLITIEAGAAHTLLCLYYYGSGKPLGHQRAYKHAVEGWNLIQKLDIHTKLTTGFEIKKGQVRPFASEIKLEWAKRVYWCAYTAATVMSCTGGFEPFGNPKDGVLNLQLRPSLDDVSAWSVMVRGAQHVSRSYRLLHELDKLRVRLAEQGQSLDYDEQQKVTAERQAIFNAMLKLDTEISNYTRFDAGWREPPPEPGDQGLKTADKELARSLKAAGRLMTSGAIIILHRAQAFTNARVFMEPQCGIPEASRPQRPSQLVNTILHHANPQVQQQQRESQACSNDYRLLPQNGVWPTGPAAHSNGISGGIDGNDGSTQRTLHPFLTDRFSGGPFEPSHSLERCRFAAVTMISTLPRILQDPCRVPKLPPYSACSYVLGAYAILMLTLFIQVRGELAAMGNNAASGQKEGSLDDVIGGNEIVAATMGAAVKYSADDANDLHAQIEMHRAPVRDIILALRKFATIWPKAADYETEVSTLLAANEILG